MRPTNLRREEGEATQRINSEVRYRHARVSGGGAVLTCRGQAEVVHIQWWRVASPPPAPCERPWYLVQHNRSAETRSRKTERGAGRGGEENVTAGR